MHHERLITILAIFTVACLAVPGMGHSAEIRRVGDINIQFNGRIDLGDASKLENILISIQNENVGFIVVPTLALNSKGGSFIEGLRIGRLLRKYGASTLVRSNAECFSACALAFLGGTMFYPTSGPGVLRKLELGGVIGFHGYYLDPEAERVVRTSVLKPYLGFEFSKILASTLAGYAAQMNVSSDWIEKTLAKGPSELYLVATVGDVLDLGIVIVDPPRVSLVSNPQAINVCNHATSYRRPLSLNGRNENGEASVRKLSAFEAKKVLLHHAAEHTAPSGFSREITNALETNDRQLINGVFNDFGKLLAIGVPTMDLDAGENFLVDGWDVVGGGFYVKDCLVNIKVENGEHIGADAILLRTLGLSGPFDRINPLWSIYDRGQSLRGIARKK